jgi:hypothetical protein
VYAPRFIFEGLTRLGCNDLPLDPVLEEVVEGQKKAKIKLYF